MTRALQALRLAQSSNLSFQRHWRLPVSAPAVYKPCTGEWWSWGEGAGGEKGAQHRRTSGNPHLTQRRDNGSPPSTPLPAPHFSASRTSLRPCWPPCGFQPAGFTPSSTLWPSLLFPGRWSPTDPKGHSPPPGLCLSYLKLQTTLSTLLFPHSVFHHLAFYAFCFFC